MKTLMSLLVAGFVALFVISYVGCTGVAVQPDVAVVEEQPVAEEECEAQELRVIYDEARWKIAELDFDCDDVCDALGIFYPMEADDGGMDYAPYGFAECQYYDEIAEEIEKEKVNSEKIAL